MTRTTMLLIYLWRLCVCVCVQHRTLEAVLDRGEKLDDLVGKSEELSLHSKAFYTTVSVSAFSWSPSFVCLSTRSCRLGVSVLYPMEFHWEKHTWIFPWRFHGFHVKNSCSWRLHGILWCLRGVFMWFCPCGMKIPWSFSHGILWNLHGKFHVFSPWNFMGYKTGIPILQDCLLPSLSYGHGI